MLAGAAVEHDVDLETELRLRAHAEAIRVFPRNLKDLLLASPAGARLTLGLDPGIRTGVKLAAVDATGKVVETATLYPFPARNPTCAGPGRRSPPSCAPQDRTHRHRHGTASRETAAFRGRCAQRLPDGRQAALKVIVVRGGGLGLFRVRSWRRRNSPISTSRCAARSPSRAACRTRWPSWSRCRRIDRCRAVSA